MSCRRARRELQWLVQFGEFDQESAPHLDHLAGCRACREEIGIDRALVRQLRTALAARIEDTAPSPTAWDGVLARMRQPEPRPSGFRPWAARLAAGLRSGTAMAGAGLALVLALNLEIVPMAPTPTPDTGAEAASRPDWAGDIPPFVVVAPPAAPIEATGVEPSVEDTSVMLRPAAQAEQLPLGRAEAATSSDARGSRPAERPGETAEVSGWQVRLVPSDAARIAGPGDAGTGAPANEPGPVPDPPLQGPS